MRIVLFSTAYNGLTQRVDRELILEGHSVYIELSGDPDVMERTVNAIRPDLIVCPFLKHRVPESIWRHTPCLIVHPGIEGDRGPSSLDWAINDAESIWGVTVLQADREMDAGDIWGCAEFSLRCAAKASIYRREVTRTAMALVHDAVARYERGTVITRPLDPFDAAVRGRLRPLMRQGARSIDWHADDTDTVVRKIRAADGFPGVLDELGGIAVYLYGAVADEPVSADPGALVSHCEGAVRRATLNGSVWIKQLKRAGTDKRCFFKLPARHALMTQFDDPSLFASLPEDSAEAPRAIRTRVEGNTAYVWFDFYNGAMNTQQCRALRATLLELGQCQGIEVVVLMGGEDFWSNGIHLNCIEASPDPARESWHNINAMDDLVQSIIENDRQVTIAAVGNNAGAGGAILPLACDRVWCREGVVLNPHYATMGLYGSEYWTYLLPRRVGEQRAQALTDECLPVVAREAKNIGLVDELLPEQWESYGRALIERVSDLANNRAGLADLLAAKRTRRALDEREKPLAAYRAQELARMKACFDDPDSDYHRLRHNFVYKISCGRTPQRLRRLPTDSRASA